MSNKDYEGKMKVDKSLCLVWKEDLLLYFRFYNTGIDEAMDHINTTPPAVLTIAGSFKNTNAHYTWKSSDNEATLEEIDDMDDELDETVNADEEDGKGVSLLHIS